VLVGDGDGIVVVPQEREREVLDTVLAIEETEERIRQEINKGTRLDLARKQLGYHSLQTRR
jgi:regulator of RNase E activity RraA